MISVRREIIEVSLLIVPASCLKAISSLWCKEGDSKQSPGDSLSWRTRLEIGKAKVVVICNAEECVPGERQRKFKKCAEGSTLIFGLVPFFWHLWEESWIYLRLWKKYCKALGWTIIRDHRRLRIIVSPLARKERTDNTRGITRKLNKAMHK